ncbi:MAG TPA: hypothetical protein VEZ55_12550 [Chitinophagaceae bacterium]|jgi:hypothetical protein|nr:hypothetical protein [Chitinophagaceae bacterium]
MGLLTPKGKKDAKKNNSTSPKNNQGSKFINNKNIKASGGFTKKQMPGSANRGS